MPKYWDPNDRGTFRGMDKLVPVSEFHGDTVDMRGIGMTCRHCGCALTHAETQNNVALWICYNPTCPNNPDSKLRMDFTTDNIIYSGNPYKAWRPFKGSTHWVPERLI